MVRLGRRDWQLGCERRFIIWEDAQLERELQYTTWPLSVHFDSSLKAEHIRRIREPRAWQGGRRRYLRDLVSPETWRSNTFDEEA